MKMALCNLVIKDNWRKLGNKVILLGNKVILVNKVTVQKKKKKKMMMIKVLNKRIQMKMINQIKK